MQSSANSPVHRAAPSVRAALLAAVCLTLPLAGPSRLAASDDALETRLQALESKVAALSVENAALKQQLGANPQAKPALGAVVPMGKEAKLALGGFLHLQGETGDAPDQRFPATDRFLVRRVRLGVKGSVMENVDFAMQADFGSNALGSVSGFRAQLTDAFVAWRMHPAATVTVGQFKVPYGYEQLQADTKIPTIERSLANDVLTLPRQVGAMISGTLFDQRVTYAGAVGNGNGTNVSFNDNDQFMYIGRVDGIVFRNDKAKVSAGANAYTSDDTGAFTGRRTGRGFDAQLAVGRLEVTGELLRTTFDADAGADYDAEGWAATGAYYLVPGRLQGVFRYETYDPNLSRGRDRTILRTIGVNWFVKGDDVKLAFDYLIGNPPGATSHQDRLICRLQVIY